MEMIRPVERRLRRPYMPLTERMLVEVSSLEDKPLSQLEASKLLGGACRCGECNLCTYDFDWTTGVV